MAGQEVEAGHDGYHSNGLHESGYRTGPDGVELYYRFWRPETVRATVLALHGMGAHGEWYESLAAELLPRGIAVLAPDLRGHGLTRWDLGKIPGPDLLLKDVDFWLGELRRMHPFPPCFLLGTSMGGILAAAAGARHTELAGIILLSPAFHPTYLTWREKAVMAISLLFGRESGAATPLGRGLALCGDALRLQWLRQDPLAQPWLPARSHWNVRRLIRVALRRLPEIRSPLLCIQGRLDPVVSAEGNRRIFSDSERCRFVLWEEAYHDLALERGEYLSGVLADWIRHHGSGTPI